MSRTPPAPCRNCGKVPEPDSPHGLCARCLMARLLDRPPHGESTASENPAPARRLVQLGPVLPKAADELKPKSELG